MMKDVGGSDGKFALIQMSGGSVLSVNNFVKLAYFIQCDTQKDAYSYWVYNNAGQILPTGEYASNRSKIVP